MTTRTLFLRLEASLQSWGDHLSKFVFRHTVHFPTKSGVLGLICAALGASREEAAKQWLPILNKLLMGVRIDQPGWPLTDYHTVGAQLGNRSAEGKIKITQKTGEIETFVTYREYLCDASFIVALQQTNDDLPPDLLHKVAEAIKAPVFTPYLGRKSCPPSAPLLLEDDSLENDGQRISNPDENTFASLEDALRFIPWTSYEDSADELSSLPVLDCYVEWCPTSAQPHAPDDAFVLYDVPFSFSPPAYRARLVRHISLQTADLRRRAIKRSPEVRTKERRRADYTNSQYRRAREERLRADNYLCVFCKSPATDVHHVTYLRAGGDEKYGDLRSLCDLCHDAITMLEYGQNLGAERIDPCDPKWRRLIIEKRNQIIRYRSLEKRRRWLATPALQGGQ